MLCLLLVQKGWEKEKGERELGLSCGVGFSCLGLFICLCVCVCECGQVYDQQLSLTCSIRWQLSKQGWGKSICRRSCMGEQRVILLWQTSYPSTAVPSLPCCAGNVVCPARLTGCAHFHSEFPAALFLYCTRAWLSRRPLKPVAVSFPCQSVVSFCFLLSIVPSIVSRAAAICGHLPTELSAAATVLKQRSPFLSHSVSLLFCLLCWFLCFKPDTWLTWCPN